MEPTGVLHVGGNRETGQLGAAAGSVGVRSSQSGRLRKLGMNWAVVADSETCTSECMSDQLATLGRNRETDQLAPLGRNREMSACQTNWHHCGRNREMSACQTNCHHWDATGR